MKQITINKGTFMFVEIPENSTKYKISSTNYLCFKIKNRWIPDVPRLLDNFQIISSTKDISEKQAEDIVEEVFTKETSIGIRCFENYNIKELYCLSAKEALQSLIKANELDINKNYLILKKI